MMWDIAGGSGVAHPRSWSSPVSPAQGPSCSWGIISISPPRPHRLLTKPRNDGRSCVIIGGEERSRVFFPSLSAIAYTHLEYQDDKYHFPPRPRARPPLLPSVRQNLHGGAGAARPDPSLPGLLWSLPPAGHPPMFLLLGLLPAGLLGWLLAPSVPRLLPARGDHDVQAGTGSPAAFRRRRIPPAAAAESCVRPLAPGPLPVVLLRSRRGRRRPTAA